ncbi:MAG: alpha/beta hydrolase [Gemmatimonadaceae bacterium]
MPMITLGDLNVHYEQRGQGDPILLIHGLGSSTEDWEPQVAALEGRYTVVAYDVRGHGRTAKPSGKYTMNQFADDAAALLQHLKLGRVHVMGLSMGGMIAFQLAADHPELVRSLIIVNSGPEMILRTWKEKMAIAQRRAIVRMMGMRKWGEVLSTRLLPLPEHGALRATFIERWARNDKAAYLRALNALVGWSVSAKLPGITCPVLVVGADQDYTPVAFKQAYTSKMPNARLVVIPDSRHMMPVERPEAFHDAILPFLAAVS